MSVASNPGIERRRRPKDRKAQIARASADAFSDLGYHGVSMEIIAGRVGVTAASLYRHYSGKYELFQEAVLGLGQQLVDCTVFLDKDDGDPERTWDRAVGALIDAARATRSSGGLYRWEGRHLNQGDQLVLNEQIKLVNRRLQLPLARLHPNLESWQRWILSSSVLSIVGSITDHRAELADDRVHVTLAKIARNLRDVQLPRVASPDHDRPIRLTVGAEAGEYEQILHSAMRLFNERGYRDTGMDEIASAVDISTTSLYRYFSGKAAILGAVYRRAADRVSGDLSSILSTAGSPREAVGQLVDAYVRRSFADPELAFVYYAERVNVPAEDQAALHNIQRAVVDAWARQVAAVMPETSPEEARFAVYAGFALVVDLGRFLSYDPSELAVVRHLVSTTLIGDST